MIPVTSVRPYRPNAAIVRVHVHVVHEKVCKVRRECAMRCTLHYCMTDVTQRSQNFLNPHDSEVLYPL